MPDIDQEQEPEQESEQEPGQDREPQLESGKRSLEELFSEMSPEQLSKFQGVAKDAVKPVDLKGKKMEEGVSMSMDKAKELEKDADQGFDLSN